MQLYVFVSPSSKLHFEPFSMIYLDHFVDVNDMVCDRLNTGVLTIFILINIRSIHHLKFSFIATLYFGCPSIALNFRFHSMVYLDHFVDVNDMV